MENVDEIEFFGFAPMTFVTELQGDIERVLREGIDGMSRVGRSKIQKVSDVLMESFRRNYFIFSNFVLGNIFKFPHTFRIERKVSDVVVTLDLQSITNELSNSFEEEEHYKVEVQKQKEELEVEKYRRDSYVSLLRCSDSVNDLLLDVKQVQEDLEAVKDLYNKLTMINNAGDEDLNMLLEYREIKNMLAKKERDELMAIGSSEVFCMINDSIRK